MRLIRLACLYLAIAMLRTSRLLMLAGGRIVETHTSNRVRAKPGATWVANKPNSFSGPMGSGKTQFRRIDRMLLGSIISLGICAAWIWITGVTR